SAPDAPPAAALTVVPTAGQAPLAVAADASASTDTDLTGIQSYTFNFGDGAVVGPQATATAGHTYAAAGTYKVTVTVTDTVGLSSTASVSVAVSAADAPPSAVLSVSPTSGGAPLAVTADASHSTDKDATPIAGFKFDFGDGTVVGPQSAAAATHSYGTPGSYTVTVTVTDTVGLASTASASVNVKVNLVGNPGFETDTSGWNTAGSSTVALTRVSTTAHSGNWSAKLTNAGTAAQPCILNDSPNWVASTIAGTYIGSMWVHADIAGATFKLKFREYQNGTA